jgi:hypothetical protein
VLEAGIVIIVIAAMMARKIGPESAATIRCAARNSA